MFNTTDVPKSSRIPKLIAALYAHMPVIESARAKLITESYKATEGQPTITRRAEAFAHILRMNWIRLQQGPRTHFTLLRKPSRS